MRRELNARNVSYRPEADIYCALNKVTSNSVSRRAMKKESLKKRGGYACIARNIG